MAVRTDRTTKVKNINKDTQPAITKRCGSVATIDVASVHPYDASGESIPCGVGDGVIGTKPYAITILDFEPKTGTELELFDRVTGLIESGEFLFGDDGIAAPYENSIQRLASEVVAIVGFVHTFSTAVKHYSLCNTVIQSPMSYFMEARNLVVDALDDHGVVGKGSVTDSIHPVLRREISNITISLVNVEATSLSELLPRMETIVSSLLSHFCASISLNEPADDELGINYTSTGVDAAESYMTQLFKIVRIIESIAAAVYHITSSIVGREHAPIIEELPLPPTVESINQMIVHATTRVKDLNNTISSSSSTILEQLNLI